MLLLPGSPSTTSSEISFKPENEDTVSTSTTKLSKEEMKLLFQGRNLAFFSNIVKRRFSTRHSSMGRNGKRRS